MPGFSGDKRGGEGAAARLSGLERRQTVNKTKQFSSTKAERGAIYHQALRAGRGGGRGAGGEAARKLMFVVDATASICTQMEVKKKEGKKRQISAAGYRDDCLAVLSFLGQAGKQNFT